MATLTKPDRIVVGMTASLTGRYSHPGRQALAGAKAWVQDTNASGGIVVKERGVRLPVRLVRYDDASNSGRCAELTRRLVVEDGVDILLGPYSSGLSLRAAAVAHRHRRVLWNHGGALEAIYQLGSEWVVGVLTPATMYFHGLIDMARAVSPAATSVAILSSTAGAFPKEVASGAERRCAELGFTTTRMYPYDAGTGDFGPILRRLATDHPDLLLGVGRIEDDVRLARQVVESGIKLSRIGLVAAALGLFREALGQAAEGFFGPSQWETGVKLDPDYGPSTEEVIKSLAAHRSSDVDYPMAQAYAACLVAQRCIEMAGSLDNRALREVAGRLDFTTFYGRYRIDPATGRQLGHTMPVVQWRHGEKVVVWPPEMKSG